MCVLHIYGFQKNSIQDASRKSDESLPRPTHVRGLWGVKQPHASFILQIRVQFFVLVVNLQFIARSNEIGASVRAEYLRWSTDAEKLSQCIDEARC